MESFMLVGYVQKAKSIHPFSHCLFATGAVLRICLCYCDSDFLTFYLLPFVPLYMKLVEKNLQLSIIIAG